jgi:suppressor for copper-sensitivity B
MKAGSAETLRLQAIFYPMTPLSRGLPRFMIAHYNPKRCLLSRCIFVLFLLLALPVQATLTTNGWVAQEQVKLRLIHGTPKAEREAIRIPLGLQFDLQPGWKTYWRNPGDAGQAVRLSLTSGTAELSPIRFPAPTRFVESWGLETFAYKEQVVLPFDVRVTTFHPLRFKVEYTVCAELCIPYTAELTLSGTLDGTAPREEGTLLSKYEARVPVTSGASPLRVETLTLQGGKLTVIAGNDLGFVSPDAFVEGPDGVRFPKPEIRFADAQKRAIFTFTPADDRATPAPLTAESFRVTVTDHAGSVEVQQAITLGTPELLATPPANTSPLWLMLLFAFLGGLILNAMPCVLPVLSIKLLAALRYGGEGNAKIRAGFLASSIGIFLSCMMLAGVTLLLRSVGTQVGWGFHFQNPVFLVLMLVVVTVFAVNLWGKFEIRLPGFIANRLGNAGRGDSFLSHLLSGMLVTLLATPCTAPFLGTAIGFALAEHTGVILAIFAAIGLGLATPYLLVALFPAMARLLPKPGAWMLKLKRFFALCMAATALWLGWVLVQQLQHRVFTSESSALHWQAFEPERIPALVAKGNRVFVDVTAAWCVTCKANKALVLDREEAVLLLSQPGVVLMRADWTSPDPKIEAFLQSHQRFGVPFNVVYGPEAPQGIILPELLTNTVIREALTNAAGKP